jgi:hypothetical protein
MAKFMILANGVVVTENRAERLIRRMIEKVLAVAVGAILIITAGCASTEQKPPTTYRVEPGSPSQYPATVYEQHPGVVSQNGSTLTNAPGAALIPHEAVQVATSAPVQQAPAVQSVPAEQTQPPPPQQMAVPPPQQQTVVVQQPPPVRMEVIPVAPAPNYVWVNGYWGWHGRWIWIPGRWAYPPRPHAVWVGGAWVHGHHGWSWHAGHWR